MIVLQGQCHPVWAGPVGSPWRSSVCLIGGGEPPDRTVIPLEGAQCVRWGGRPPDRTVGPLEELSVCDGGGDPQTGL